MNITREELMKMELDLKKSFITFEEGTTVQQLQQFINDSDNLPQILQPILKMHPSVALDISVEAMLHRIFCLKLKVKRMLFLREAKDMMKNFIFEETESAFNECLRTGCITNLTFLDPKNFLIAVKNEVLTYVKHIRDEFKSVKANLSFNVKFVLYERKQNKCVRSKAMDLYLSSDLYRWFDQAMTALLTEIDEIQDEEGGWTLHSIINLGIEVDKLNPIKAGSWIDLPAWIKNKKAVVNLLTTNQECFAYSIMAALYPNSKAHRLYNYPDYREKLKFDGIDFPVKIADIPTFEKLNNISVNVFGAEKEKIYVIHSTSEEKKCHVNLLLITDGKNSHYCWIKNLSRLLSSQYNNAKGKKFICTSCLRYFSSTEKMQSHKAECQKFIESAINLPTPDKTTLKFMNFARKLPTPFTVFADMKCLLGTDGEFYKGYKRQTYCVGFYLYCSFNPFLSRYLSYRGQNCANWLKEQLKLIADEFSEAIVKAKPIDLNPEEMKRFKNATTCQVCNKPFEDDDSKVRNHCVYTGKFEGAAHGACNVNHRINYTIPVIFHKLSNRDAHFIVKEVADTFDGAIQVKPLNEENYLSFNKTSQNTKSRFFFIDSSRFFNLSVSELNSLLDDEQKMALRSEFESEDEFSLLTKKCLFPDNYVSDFSVLEEQHLPPIEYFYNESNKFYVSKDDYINSQKVWKKFNCMSLGEYCDLTLKVNILIFADFFNNFRRVFLDSHQLDISYYFKLSDFVWDCAFMHSQVKLDLLTDTDMILFIEKGTRGSLCYCSSHHSLANNLYLSDFKLLEPSKYIFHGQFEDLYEWSMGQPLPTGNFTWLQNVKNFNVLNINDDAEIGYILEVDLTYPKELHNIHSDFPFCPEKTILKGSKSPKLLSTQFNKTHYVLHYRNLKQAVVHGVKIDKIHRILQFNQSAWLRKFINHNNDCSAKAENDFLKKFYKSMNNALFSKLTENIRNSVDIFIKDYWDGRYGAESLISRPNFYRRLIFSEECAAFELKKISVTVNKPVYLGMCLMDISKTLLYSFHYDYILKYYKEDAKLLYIDTNHLIYEFKCDFFYENLKYQSIFDTSNYPAENVYKVPVKKKSTSLVKDKYAGCIIREFIGLRSRMYSERMTEKCVKLEDDFYDRSCKFNDYAKCLQNWYDNVHILDEDNLGLNLYDDKRCTLKQSHVSVPWGHKLLMTDGK